ncbi:MAG TPA: hypothetical protein PLV68_20805, partial [Ilumatobacteraceae bacterium]|nr:hypothetical protein [Ilumatobacteraceae bacterium]
MAPNSPSPAGSSNAPAQLQKAFLETETGERIPCMFNPDKFSFSTSNRWEADNLPGLIADVLGNR